MRVRVTAITGAEALAVDEFGHEVTVRNDIRRGIAPRIGELWVIDQTLGAWTFAARLARAHDDLVALGGNADDVQTSGGASGVESYMAEEAWASLSATRTIGPGNNSFAIVAWDEAGFDSGGDAAPTLVQSGTGFEYVMLNRPGMYLVRLAGQTGGPVPSTERIMLAAHANGTTFAPLLPSGMYHSVGNTVFPVRVSATAVSIRLDVVFDAVTAARTVLAYMGISRIGTAYPGAPILV